MERKLAAIMAGDVVGYSRMMAEDESGTYNQLRSALDEIVRPALERHGGRVFKNTGDGFLASFPSVNEALDAAIDIQGGFAQRAMQLRIGLNLGDVIEEDGDVFGDGVNIAARLEAMAEPGSIYVSAAVVRSADKNRSERFERIGGSRSRTFQSLSRCTPYGWSTPRRRPRRSGFRGARRDGRRRRRPGCWRQRSRLAH